MRASYADVRIDPPRLSPVFGSLLLAHRSVGVALSERIYRSWARLAVRRENPVGFHIIPEAPHRRRQPVKPSKTSALRCSSRWGHAGGVMFRSCRRPHLFLPAICFLVAFAAASVSQPAYGRRGSNDRDDALTSYYWAQPLVGWPLNRLQAWIPALDGLAADSNQSSLRQILSRVADNVRAFRTNFSNTTALETIEQERLKPNGSPRGHVVRQQFRYLVLTTPGNEVNLREYRTDLVGHEQVLKDPKAGFVKTSGFASLPMELGADRQPQYDFKYLGSQAIDGRRTEVIAFAGHPVEQAISGQYVLSGKPIPMIVQGVAWIDAASYQVVRMQTELLAPLTFAGLARLSTSVVFHEVKFQISASAFWLPQVVDVTADFFGETYHNRHTYSDYQLFFVGTDQRTPQADAKAPR